LSGDCAAARRDPEAIMAVLTAIISSAMMRAREVLKRA